MLDKLLDIKKTPAATERRSCPRLRAASLLYVDIGNVNGGIVTSLSEKGLALAAANTLGNAESVSGPVRVRIRLPGTPEAIEAKGENVWTSPSGKEACVRFVEISEKGRDQIRRWISDQASSNGLRPEPPKLPKMKLPNSRRAKPRPSRFSFADVASSRVDDESETLVEDFPAIAGRPGSLPPLQAGHVGFHDGTEEVAPAFESPAIESPPGGLCSAANQQAAQAGLDSDLHPESAASIPERRQRPRKEILLFTYAVLGEDNGGLVFNLGEGGLAITAAAALEEHDFLKMRVRFPDSTDWFETGGRVAWKNDSGKEAGIEFLDLPGDARARIREWIPQGEPAGDLPSTEGGTQTSQSPVPELPSFMEPEESSSEPFETPASFEELLLGNRICEEQHSEKLTKTPAASSSALLKTDIRGVTERVSVKRGVGKIKPPQILEYSVRSQPQAARRALRIAAGVVLAAGVWVLLQQTSLNEASGIIAQNLPNTQPTHEPPQARGIAKTDAGASRATAEAPAPNASKIAATFTNSLSKRPSNEKPHFGNTLERLPVENASPRTGLGQSQHPTLPQHKQETTSPQLPASAPASSLENDFGEDKLLQSKPGENKPVQIAQALPPQNKNLSATSPSPSVNPPQPTAAPPVDLGVDKPPAAPKQPEPTLARKPVVTVSLDPFPSIRMPSAEKSKKSRQGKSLQMGRLIMRVDPVYPEEARQQGIEGTVRLHAIFNRDGAAQNVVFVSGPPLLMPAALHAVRQWRYSPTILGGKAMETEEDVSVLFRLENPAAKN